MADDQRPGQPVSRRRLIPEVVVERVDPQMKARAMHMRDIPQYSESAELLELSLC